MKFLNIPVLLINILLFNSLTVKAQDINWANLKKSERHIVHLNAGLDNGIIFGLGYGYQLKTKLPVILNAEYSFPAGEDLLDDFKTKFGGQVKLYQFGNFQLSAKIHGLFRRYQNSLVRMLNFGSDMRAVAGYYRPKWFVAGEFGFDKAIVTNFKHSEIYKEIFPMVKDGWYEPATGGNFNYGLQGGISFKRSDLYLKAGKLIAEDFKTDPFVPFYVQFGYNYKIAAGGKK